MHARELLHRGEAVPDQMIARMLDIKMRSPEVAHHGLYKYLIIRIEYQDFFNAFLKVIFWMDFH